MGRLGQLGRATSMQLFNICKIGHHHSTASIRIEIVCLQHLVLGFDSSWWVYVFKPKKCSRFPSVVLRCQKRSKKCLRILERCGWESVEFSGPPPGWTTRRRNWLQVIAVWLDFIQCTFPNQIQFGLEKLRPKITYDFPNQFQFGLEWKKLILQDADSKPNSDWFRKFWWPLSMSWKFQTKFSLVWKNHWLLPTPWTLNEFHFYFGNIILERENTQTYKYKIN